jgi:hypothetical protein
MEEKPSFLGEGFSTLAVWKIIEIPITQPMT